ncbi:hypothetical protein D3C75_721460 [compost metagenome]
MGRRQLFDGLIDGGILVRNIGPRMDRQELGGPPLIQCPVRPRHGQERMNDGTERHQSPGPQKVQRPVP